MKKTNFQLPSLQPGSEEEVRLIKALILLVFGVPISLGVLGT